MDPSWAMGNLWEFSQSQHSHMGVSKNRGGPPKSSILIRFSIINHPFWGFSPYFWVETPICIPKEGQGQALSLNFGHVGNLEVMDAWMDRVYLDVPDRKLGSKVIGSVGYKPIIYPIYK